MNQQPNWYYNEMLLPGQDFFSPEVVRAYDEKHGKFRDVEKDNEQILDLLSVRAGQSVIDIGTGTGSFAVQAARRGAMVYAVDISRNMLDYAREKAEKAGVTKNIDFRLGGFLSYEHSGEPVDAIASQMVLHHLPDTWKQVAIQRVADMLKPGGKFFLADVVFSFQPKDYDAYFSKILADFGRKCDDTSFSSFETHIRQEYSTLDWIMEGILSRAGLTIEKLDRREGFLASYSCSKS
jgi:cyclopropane fatty-acyl-phospholipid synthase-like methyltransferase